MEKVKKVEKRDGTIVDFDKSKIKKAVYKAITATDQGDGKESQEIADKVTELLSRRFKEDEVPTVEQIQDIVEEALILEGLVKTAKAFILYREQRRKVREAVAASEEAVDRIDDYLGKLDWEIQENANMSFSLQGLNRYGIAYIVKKYWLNKIYPKEIREANESCSLHVHDLGTLGCYTFFGREVVVARLNGKIRLISLKNLYGELQEEEKLLNEKDEAFGKYPDNLHVLDKDGWTRVKRMVRKKKDRKMQFVKSEQGRSIVVTDNHPFIVKRNGEEMKVEAKDVQEKDDLAFSAHIPSLLSKENLFSKNYLFLAEELLENNYQKFFLEGFEWQDFQENWGGSAKVEGTLSTSNSANSLDNKLELTEDLGYLTGLFVADGHYDSWRLVITNNNEKIIKKVRRICSNLGARTYIRESKDKATQIAISSSSLKLVFEKIFKIKALSKNKNLPLDVLTYSKDFIKGLIAGIIDGDGSVDPKNKSNSDSQVIIRVVSRTMLEQIATLLQFFGIVARSGVRTSDIGKTKTFKGKEITQNYPLYRLNFSKQKGVDFPSFKYEKARAAKQSWRAEEYDWNKVLNSEFTTVADDTIFDITTDSSTFLANGLLVHNCMGWDLFDLLQKGFGGVSEKLESKPPKHLGTALGQIVNFLYTLQGECAGAVAFSNFDTLLAPFIRYDNLSYTQVRQAMQRFLHNMAVPTRVGFQCPFTNITLDLKPAAVFADQPVIIGGEAQEETYGEFKPEMETLIKAFYDVILQGDKSGRPFHFPIPTINITKDFPWNSESADMIFKASAKYGTNYFANYINSSMSPDDVRSMCCRLRLNMKELHNRGGGGLFGSGSLTGSIGVVTINLPRIAYLSKTKKEFLERLEKLMDLAKKSLEIKRKSLEDYIEKGLYPYSKFYLSSVKKMRGSYYANHFSTIGLVGMNEACLNFIGEDITTDKGRKFSLEVMDFMRDKLKEYQEETGHIYNLEATPAESTAYRLALADKEKYPDIITAGTEEDPYYTNSSQLPVGFTTDAFEALENQDELQSKYTGGCIEKGNKVLTDKGLLSIEDIVKDFDDLKPIKALSYNSEERVSEWDKIEKAVSVDVEKHNKIRVRGERNLDIITSDWHPFFVLEKFKPNPGCPICGEELDNIQAFASHLRWNEDCREAYKDFPKYKVAEKRADELEEGDYILQNSDNLYPDKETKLNDNLMWLIGFFIGDGSISKSIDNRGGNHLERFKVRFFSERQKSLKKIVRILQKYFDCNVSIIQNNKRSKKLREISTAKKEVSDFFFKYGFEVGRKVYNVSISQKIKDNLNKENVFSLLSGLLDSDGTINKRDGDAEYMTVSSNLADDMLEIFSRAGIMVSKSLKKVKKKNEKNLWRFRISAYEMTRIKDQLDNTTHRSRIKEALSNRKKHQLPVVRVKEASKVDVKDNQFYDLMTRENHNYLAGKDSLVFIHNTVLHLFLGEKIKEVKSAKKLVKTVFEKYHLPYITLTPTFSICPVHGYISGEHFTCPKCAVEQPCEVYSRIVGYLRPVKEWNKGKKKEYEERKEFENEESVSKAKTSLKSS